MIKIIEYGILASHVYHPYKTNEFGIGFLPCDAHHKEKLKDYNGWIIVTDTGSFVHPDDHFYAALYIKFCDGVPEDAVIAIRGTVASDWTNTVADIIAWSSDGTGDGGYDQIPIFFHQAIVFEDKAYEYLRKYYPSLAGFDRIKYTGHSLGGAIAQLLTLKGMHSCRSVVFNSPGCAHIPGVKGNRGFGVYNINARYGLVNKIGETLGKLFLIDIPEQEPEAKAIFEGFNQDDFKQSLEQFRERHQDKSIAQKLRHEMEGDILRTKSYVSTISTVSAFPETHVAELQCESEHEKKHWYDLKNKIAQSHCPIDAVIETYSTVFTAQHSMDNMIKALQAKENSALASIFC